MTERKPNLLPIVVGGAAVAIAGGIGAYFFFSKTDITPGSAVGTLSVVPQQSIMAMSLSTDGAAIAQLEQFLNPETKKLYDQATAEFRKGLSSGDFDYEKDVKPWIGKNVTVAFLPAEKTASFAPNNGLASRNLPHYVPMSDNGAIAPFTTAQAPASKEAAPKQPEVDAEAPNLIIVVEVKDKAGVDKFLTEKVKAKSGNKEKKSDYKGVTITEYGEGATASASAMVGDYLVVSPRPELTQKAIDTFKGEASLAKSASADDLKLKNAVAQIYIPNFADSIMQLSQLGNSPETIPPETLAQLKQIKSISMGVGIDDVGIRFKVASKFDPAAISALKNSPNKVISLIPSEAFAFATGTNLKGSWEQFVKSANSTPELKQGIDQARTQLKSSPLALDLDKDIFGWMDGEFAIASVSGKPEGILAQTQGLAPLFIFQTTNRAAGESLMKKLDDFISKNGGQVGKKDMGGVAVTEWSVPGAPGAIISHGWNQQDMLFMTASPIVSMFVPKPASAIDADANFKAIVGTLPSSNVGYFYIDGDRTWKIAQTFLPPNEKIPAEVKAMFDSIRGFGVTAAYPTPESAEVEAVLALKKGGK